MAPASSRGVLIPTRTSVFCDTSLGSDRNRSSPALHHQEDDGQNEPENKKELGIEEYYDCTVDIRECFQPAPPRPFHIANQNHLNDNSD